MRTLEWLLVAPFTGLMVSIVLIPTLFSRFWHCYHMIIIAFWIVLATCSYLWTTNLQALTNLLKIVLFDEYIPLICAIGALYVVSGGIHISLRVRGGPLVNTLILAIGSLAANLVGATGAALLFARPFMRINAYRQRKSHLIIFFIFTVCNIGGCLTPLGDAPMFLGFLAGIPLLWPLQNIGFIFLSLIIPLLGIFFLLDMFVFHLDRKAMQAHEYPDHSGIRIQGKRNIPWLLLIISTIIINSLWQSSPEWAGIKLSNVLRDISLIGIILASRLMTPKRIYDSNHFNNAPLKEVGILFLGIFITLAPMMELLHSKGFFFNLASWLNSEVHHRDFLYFWLTGCVSFLLDNVPTYLVFFQLAGGDAFQLSHNLSSTLAAITCGAVFMGATTYIGNAPNSMIKSLAEHNHIRMPSFLGFLVWACLILLPLFIGVSWYWWG